MLFLIKVYQSVLSVQNVISCLAANLSVYTGAEVHLLINVRSHDVVI